MEETAIPCCQCGKRLPLAMLLLTYTSTMAPMPQLRCVHTELAALYPAAPGLSYRLELLAISHLHAISCA